MEKKEESHPPQWGTMRCGKWPGREEQFPLQSLVLSPWASLLNSKKLPRRDKPFKLVTSLFLTTRDTCSLQKTQMSKKKQKSSASRESRYVHFKKPSGDSHTARCTHFKCIIKYFKIYVLGCTSPSPQSNVRTFHYPRKKPLAVTSHFFPPRSPRSSVLGSHWPASRLCSSA